MCEPPHAHQSTSRTLTHEPLPQTGPRGRASRRRAARARPPRSSRPGRRCGRRSHPSCSTRWPNPARSCPVELALGIGGAFADRARLVRLARPRARRERALLVGEIGDRGERRLVARTLLDGVGRRARSRTELDRVEISGGQCRRGRSGVERWRRWRSAASKACRGGPARPLVGGSDADARDDSLVRTPRVRVAHVSDADRAGMTAVGQVRSGALRAGDSGITTRTPAARARPRSGALALEVQERQRRRPSRRPARAALRPSIRRSGWLPSASYCGGTEASAIACLRIGLQPWLVARPTWRPPAKTGTGERSTDGLIAGGRPCASYSPSMSYQSSWRPTSRRAGPPARASRSSARRPTKSPLVEVDQPAEPDLARRVVLLGVHRVAGRRVVDLEQDESGFEADDVEGEHPGRPDAVRAAGRDERVPDLDRARGRDPQLVAEVAGVAGPRDVDRDLADLRGAAPEVAQVGERLAGRRLEHVARQRALERERRGRLGLLVDRDVEAARCSGGASGAADRPPSSDSAARRGGGPSRRRRPCRSRRTTGV